MDFAITVIFPSMNNCFFSSSTRTCLAAVIAHIFLLPTTPIVQAAAAAQTELYATASDGTPLHWDVYTPDGNGPWPAVLLIHVGGFKSGSRTEGDLVNCAHDLAAAGFIAFSIEYRLAPNGYLPGQVSSGRFPDQTDDVKLAVLAARADSRCNGQVGAVGGSAGGSHAAFVAVTGDTGLDRIDAAVCLSGAYDFSDFSPDPDLTKFTDNVTNYVGVTSDNTAALRAASPAYLADSSTAPLFLINSSQDPMPFSQLADMTTKLDAHGVTNYSALTIPGSQHAFGYWGTVKDQAISFLAFWFASVPPPPRPTPEPSASPTKMLLNVSTRVRVESGASVMIGGFILTGHAPKKVALRAIGPSLTNAGVSDTLADPTLQLYDSTGTLVAENDNCSSLPPNSIPADLKPLDGHESFISVTLPPGSYTSVLSGANGTSGIGLFELYDLDPASSRISNISTRGDVGTGNDVMIGGFIIGGLDPTKVVLRAIGPSLVANGIPNALPDPVLQLYDGNGSLVFANDNWRTAQEQQIIDSGVPPTDDHESAIVATLSPGNYTAMVYDANQEGGVALVEVYDLETQ